MCLIAGVVILYNPDIKSAADNISSYLPFVKLLYVIDNTSEDQVLHSAREKLSQLSEKIIYISNGINQGIGRPLNYAAQLAHEKGFEWLLTMDQDSYFTPVQLDRYKNHFSQHFCHDQSVAVVAPSYSHERKDTTARILFHETNAAITSGSLINLNTWKSIGGYNEEMFIDEVDNDFCYRARIAKFKVMAYDNVFIEHTIGKAKLTGYFGFLMKRQRIIHSSFRLYYIVRNYLYVRKKYRSFFPADFAIRDKQVFTTVKNNLLFGNGLFKNLSSMIRACRDYRFDKKKTRKQ